MKKNILITTLLFLTLTFARAGFNGYNPYSITNQTVTAPQFVTNVTSIALPSVAFTAVATNLTTITTNTIICGLPGTSYQTANIFVYNSGIYGTNFSTNFPPQTITFTNITGFQCVPQSTGNSNLCLETFN